MYNLVGFQTKLTYPEQERVLRLIPALKEAVFHRYGSIHRNSFINGPDGADSGSSAEEQSFGFFCGADHGCGRLCRIHCHGPRRSHLCALLHKRQAFRAAATGDHCRCLTRLRHHAAERFPAHECQFRLLANYNKKRKEAVVRNALAAIVAWREQIEESL